MFPPMQSWDSIHPLIVHFPIALLMVAPLFVVLSLVFRKQARPFAFAALTLMVLGTIAAVAAVSSGEAGAELVDRSGGVDAVLEQHEELAETTRTVFLAITGIYTLIVLAPFVFKKVLAPIPATALNGSFLALYLVATVLLVNTAHLGGVLVHKYGTHAMIDAGTPVVASNAGESGHEKDDDR